MCNTLQSFILNNMKLKEEYINTIHYIKALDKNVKVENNPFMYAYYKSLGLTYLFETNDTNTKGKRK